MSEHSPSDERTPLACFLRPERVALVGASGNRSSVGGVLLENLLRGGFEGVVYPVNPRSPSVQSVAAFESLTACPEVPDLAVVAVPAEVVVDVVDEAGRLGVPSVCIISAGFSEAGEEGEARQRELVDVAARHGVRVIGPNCMGVLNGAAGVRLNATFSAQFPDPGHVALLSQSGAVGLTALDRAQTQRLGLSGFVSIGNAADVSATEVMEHWGGDDDTEVILLYLESIDEPREFGRVARRIGREKPIVAVKSGRTGAGERAASSHTASVATGEVAVDALFSQTGVVRTDTLEEMFDVAAVLSGQPKPTGRRVGIITNGGGPGILAADACEAWDLEVPHLSDRVQEGLLDFLPAEASPLNPVDLLASADAEAYRRAIETIGASGEVDALLVVFIPPIVTRPEDVAEAIVACRDHLPDDIPVVSVFMGGDGAPDQLHDHHIPSFPFPEEAVRALGRVSAWASWTEEPAGETVRPSGLDPDAARELVRGVAGDGRGDETWLSTADAVALFDHYGIPLVRSETVTTPDDAVAAAERMGFPVAVKIDAPLHKTDVGGIETGLDDPDAVTAAVSAIRERLHDQDLAEHGESLVVQQMLDGVEMAVGVNQDPSFGPLLMVGLGGELLELISDISVRVTPVSDRDVDAMLEGLRAREVLHGYRGRPAPDVDGLKDLLHRVNALVEDIPEIAELDLNPVFLREDGVEAVDVRVRIS